MKSIFIIFAMLFAVQTHAANITDNTLNLGTGTGTKKINFKGTPGYLGWDATTGKLVFSNDGTVVKALGSGSGGGAGALTLLTNGGFEDGVTTEFNSTGATVTATSAANALIGTTSAVFDPTALNDFVRTNYFTVPKGLRANACEARFLYTGGDALNYKAQVEDQTGNVLATFRNELGNNVLPIHSIPGYESIFFACPTEEKIALAANNGNIRLVIYQGTATNAAAMTIDDVHLGGLIGLTESTTPDEFSASIDNTGLVIGENVDWIEGNCAQTGGLGKRQCTFKAGLFTNTPSCSVTPTNSGVIGDSTSTTIAYLRTQSPSSIETWIQQGTTFLHLNHFIRCSKQGVDAKQSVQLYKSIPKVSDNINTFTAFVNNAGGVSLQNTPWLTSCTNSAAGVYDCTMAAGVFSSVPNILITLRDGSGSCREARLISTTTTSFQVNSFNSAGAAVSCAFVLNAQRTDDHKMPTVQPIVIGQVTNSAAETGLSNVRTEYCSVANGGTASMDGGPGLCESWVQSVTRSGTGLVQLVWKPGIFSSFPVCTGNVVLAAHGYSLTFSDPNLASRFINIRTGLGATAGDYNFYVSCTGKR